MNNIEAYKYTNIKAFIANETDYSSSEKEKAVKVPEEFRCNVESMEAYTFFAVNGNFIPHKNNLPKGIFASGFSEAKYLKTNVLEQYYGKIAQTETDPLTAINTNIAKDGFFLHISKNFESEKPIQIINILASDKNLSVAQRNMIVFGENARAKVLICDHTLSPVKYSNNSVTEVQIGKGANLDFCNLQNQHNATAQVAGYYFNQEEKSVLSANFITLHTGIARNNIFVRLSGIHSECFLSGLYLCDKKQHVDNFTFIDHAAPDCTSNELFKGVMDDASTAAFAGKILVRPNSQRTNAYQSNNNLLLTNEARVNSKPQLEIYADDVKCSHGATVGQLDENALFYMRQRGISRQEAYILLQYAFAYEVIEKIKLPELKERIRLLVEKRFRGQLDKCDSCVLCRKMDSRLGC